MKFLKRIAPLLTAVALILAVRRWLEQNPPAPGRPPMRWWERLIEQFAMSKVGAWVILNVTHYTDPVLMRLTNGRLSSNKLMGHPPLLLTTTGAKSGLPRTVSLLGIEDGDNLIVIASRGGEKRHPGWYHNLKANPEVTVERYGRSRTYHAREAAGSERERLWQKAVRTYAGYEVYQQRAGDRQIPVIVLTPTNTEK